MKSNRQTRIAVITLFAALAITLQTSAQTIITFDAPGAGTGAFQGTSASSINPKGEVTGFSRDSGDRRHGYVRSSKGDFTTFDAPGAGTGAFQGTRAYSINPAGEVTGWYSDSGDRRHGYVRDNKGTITTFDAPGAGTDAFQGTFPDVGPNIINPAGAIVGHYLDANFVSHGFVRDSDGTITTFDAPGAGSVPSSAQGTWQGTFPLSINPAGAIAGVTQDASNVLHGFLRHRDGAFTTFDAPGAGSVTDSLQGTGPSSINPAGAIAGNTLDASNVFHGFLRDRDGNFTTFDAPGAGNAPGEGTLPSGNNPSGKITGTYLDSGNLFHGFLRTPKSEED